MKSMTGFGSAECEIPEGVCTVEMTSVNRKTLDLQIALPRSCSALEAGVAKTVRAACARGRIQVRVSLESDSKTQALPIDQDRAKTLLHSVNGLANELGLRSIESMSELLRVPGLMSVETSTGPLAEDVQGLILACVGDARDALIHMRESEGAALERVLTEQLVQMRALADRLPAERALATDKLRTRLIDGMKELGVQGLGEDPRLLQEIAFYAEKADICEEVDRLASHLDQLGEKLQSKDPVGRGLDFLGQEIGREVNTICSKSQDLEVTRIALGLKERVDQFREQCLNVE